MHNYVHKTGSHVTAHYMTFCSVHVIMRVMKGGEKGKSLLITSGVMWHDVDSIRLVKQILQLLYGNCSHYRYWAWPWNWYAS